MFVWSRNEGDVFGTLFGLARRASLSGMRNSMSRKLRFCGKLHKMKLRRDKKKPPCAADKPDKKKPRRADNPDKKC